MNSLLLDISILCATLVLILASCELFTNGIEWLGQHLGLGEGVVGSVLAAVGTALPETVIPIIAVLFFGAKHGQEVGIGSITGAPFMLSTLTLGLCGCAAFLFSRLGWRSAALKFNPTVLSRDLSFFMAAYVLALIASWLSKVPSMHWLIGIALVLTYGLYLRQTFKHKSTVGVAPETLHFGSLLGTEYQGLRVIVPQVIVGCAGIICGAFLFVEHIQSLAHWLNFPPLILSFVVAPIATEAPEKVNSILWLRHEKDTLALGNITGALVFQSCIPVAFAVTSTAWSLAPMTVVTAIAAVLSAAAYLYLIKTNRLSSKYLMVGALIYAVTIYLLCTFGKS